MENYSNESSIWKILVWLIKLEDMVDELILWNQADFNI